MNVNGVPTGTDGAEGVTTSVVADPGTETGNVTTLLTYACCAIVVCVSWLAASPEFSRNWTK